ncbi:MAG: S8 family serine peptidase, partial [Candidatus Limnocylindrales bacterium]
MRFRAVAVVAVSFFLLTSLLPAGVFAKSTPQTATTQKHVQRITLQEGQKIDGKLVQAMKAPTENVMVILQMAGDPVAVRQAAAGHRFSTAEQASVRKALKAPQALLAPRIKALGGHVIGTMQDAYDGVQVYVKASQIGKLAALPGVVKVHAVQTYTRDNVNAVPYVQAPAAWATGLTGSTEWIAVIDTGIDFYHANFGGSGDSVDFTYGEAHDTVAPAFNHDGTTQAFPSAKVIGGYDFAGDAYDADTNPIPAPDPNPLDCGLAGGGDGHGSHTAGTAAGEGVLANGTTFTGPYDATTETDNSFLIGPGVAPQAKILSYRVFGCTGSTSLVTLAINQAVADGASVISMSLGSDFAAPVPADDPDIVASDNAAGAGIVVVAASGNA